ncbi:MAG: hypothetical protein ACKVQU_04175 [Burkholderiales bacterium]
MAEARKASEDVKKIRDDPGRGDPRAARKALDAEARGERMSAYTLREMLNDYFERHASKLAKGIEQECMLRHDVLPSWGGAPHPRRRHATPLTCTSRSSDGRHASPR